VFEVEIFEVIGCYGINWVLYVMAVASGYYDI